MQRFPAQSSLDSVRQALRRDPKYAGVSDQLLDEIATMISSSTTRKILESLRSVQLFEALADEDVARIQELGETVELAPGEVLFEEGKKGDSFYIVLRGRVELVKRARDGSEEKLAVAREGETFGEMALLNQSPRSATARAIEPSSLLELSRAAFDSMLGGESFAVRMLRGVAKALWATSVRFTAGQSRGASPRDVLRSLSQVMQKSVLPSRVPQVPGFSAMARTGTHEKAEGESVWDCFQLGDGRWVFASLRTHSEGLPAGSTLVLVRTLLRELGRDQSDLGKLLGRVNEALIGARAQGARQQVECALVALDQGELTWAAAGPVNAAIVRAGGGVLDLPGESPALGVERSDAYGELQAQLVPGDSFLGLAGAAHGALDVGKAVLGEMGDGVVSDVVERITASLPVDDPVTGDVFENTVVMIRCMDEAVVRSGRDLRASSSNVASVSEGHGGPDEGSSIPS